MHQSPWNGIMLPFQTHFSFSRSQTFHYLLTDTKSMFDSQLWFFEVSSPMCSCFSKENKKPTGALGLQQHKQLRGAWHTTQPTHHAQQQTGTIFLPISHSSSKVGGEVVRFPQPPFPVFITVLPESFFIAYVCLISMRKRITKYLMLAYEISSLVLAAQCERKTDTVRWGILKGKKRILLSRSQGTAKEAFTSAPPMLILQPPVIITLSSSCSLRWLKGSKWAKTV